MKGKLHVLIAFVAVIFLWQCNKVDDNALRKKALLSGLKVLPEAMPGSEKDTPELIALGQKLYDEKALSINDTQSCASCHSIEVGGDDPNDTPTSEGALGEFGDRNTPTVLNAGFHFRQFWDGRAADLAEQAKGPILNPVEMAMESEEQVVEKLSQMENYVLEFAQVFPEEKNAITYDNIAHAIAAFERTLITRDRFDGYLNGDNSALSPKEKEGLELFVDVGCTVCHNGPAIGGNSYQKMGAIHPYEGISDAGRFDVTKKEEDRFFFKVPSLRNIAETAPYFHDGKIASLHDAVQQMAHMQIDVTLDNEETEKIVSFLKSLSGKLP